MTFHGKPDEQESPRPLRTFAYRIFDGGMEHEIAAHEIYFYEAGRIGFWNYDDNGERVLVRASALGMMHTYAAMTGLPAPDQILGGQQQ
jgi:hypothetical protein